MIRALKRSSRPKTNISPDISLPPTLFPLPPTCCSNKSPVMTRNDDSREEWQVILHLMLSSRCLTLAILHVE